MCLLVFYVALVRANVEAQLSFLQILTLMNMTNPVLSGHAEGEVKIMILRGKLLHPSLYYIKWHNLLLSLKCV